MAGIRSREQVEGWDTGATDEVQNLRWEVVYIKNHQGLPW